jgi:hypothetical protein
MSTYWGYFCKDCKVDTGPEINKGDLLLIELAPVMRAIVERITPIVHGYLEVDLLGWYADISLLDFWMEHSKHSVVVFNEYGDEREIS